MPTKATDSPKARSQTKTKAKAKVGDKAKRKEKPRSKTERKAGGGAEPGRPIWKGSVSFGLVNVPVTLYPLEKRAADISFRLLDSRDHAGIRYQRVNEDTGQEVSWDQIVKGYEYSDGNYVIVTDEDFEKVAVESTQTIEIRDFVDRDEIDEAFFDKPYVLVPGKKAKKGYVLLREALERTNKVGISKVVIRTREYLAAVEPRDDALVLMLMRFAHELRNIEAFNLPKDDLDAYRISERELDLAEQLVESMAAKWEPEKYRDEYRDALMELLEEKASKGDIAEGGEPKKPKRREASNVIDLAELLRKSMQEGSTKKLAKEGSSKKRAS
jgi:DNA end-binding protein Ku